MRILGELARYFVDRHTAAIAALFLLYAVVIAWCGTAGTAEVQQRIRAVAARYGEYDAAHVSTVPAARTVSVAIVKLRDPDAAFLHGDMPTGTASTAQASVSAQAVGGRPHNRHAATDDEEGDSMWTRTLPLRWCYALPIGDVTLLDVSPAVEAAGVVPRWVKRMQAAFPNFAFAPLDTSSREAGGGTRAPYPAGELIHLPPLTEAEKAMQDALFGQAHNQGLRVLLLDALPSPAELRAARAAPAVSAAADALFVFVTASATRAWSMPTTAAVDEAPHEPWWRLPHTPPRSAWEAMLESTAQSRGAAATLPSAAPAAETEHLLPPVRAALRRYRSGRSGALPETVLDVLRFVPRLALHLAHVHDAPYVVLASWCTAAGTYTWATAGAAAAVRGAGEGAQAHVQVLCLHDTEVIELTPSLLQISRMTVD